MMIEDTETPETPAETVETPAETVAETPKESGVDAFDRGVAELPESEGGKGAAQSDAANGATGAAATAQVAGATAGATGAAVGATGPAKEPTPEEKEKAVKDAVVEAELKKFNDELRAQGSKPLSKAAAARFRELSNRPTQDDVKKQLADVEAKFKPREELAQTAERMNNVIAETGANPDQIGSVFSYLRDINSGNPEFMRRALKSMQEEVAWLAGQLGESVQGVDPLEAHPDLKAMVAEGDMKLAAAMEVVKSRAQNKLHQQNTQAQTQVQQQTRAEQEKIAKKDADFAAMDAKFKASDPNYAVKLKMLAPTIKAIKATTPVENWANAVEIAYNSIEVPKAAPAVAPPPIRPTGNTAPVVKVPKNGVDAFNMGLDTLNG